MADASIIAKFGGDTGPLRSAIGQAKGMVGGFVAEIAALASVSVFIGLAKQAIDLGSSLADTSKQLGIHVEKLQALQYAAIGAGVKEEELANALKRTRIFAEEAAQGGEKQLAVLRQLNIDTEKFFKAPLDQKLELIGKAFKSSKDQGQAFNAVAEIFGAKVGPQMTTLITEAAKGMGKLTKEAKDAGAVMSASTVAALDKAGDAIEEFKRKVTVSVGNILVNFRTEEGIKLLTYQLLRAAVVFGTKLLSVILALPVYVQTAFALGFQGAINFFRDKMVDAVKGVAEMLNKILPSQYFFKFDTASLDKFKSSGRYVGEQLELGLKGAAAHFAKTVSKDMPTAFDKVIADQQKVVDNLNKIEFKADVKALTTSAEKAGQNINDAAKNLVEAGQSVKEAAAQVAEAEKSKMSGNGFIGFGNPEDRMNASDEELKEQVRRNRKAERESRNFALNPKDQSGLAGALNAAWFSSIAMLAEQELARRSQFRSNLARGEDFARQQFNGDPLQFDELVQRYTQGLDKQDKTNDLLKRINDKLSGYGTNT